MNKKLYQNPISELVVLDPLMVTFGLGDTSGLTIGDTVDNKSTD